MLQSNATLTVLGLWALTSDIGVHNVPMPVSVEAAILAMNVSMPAGSNGNSFGSSRI
ncbi:hypothetical protein l11_06320 [Neisseria weaveri LMG 5135]|nr:hypothetical protein l11_06320 [Neisseria weaveri LMG 5135]